MKIDVLIAGAGLSGLTAACECQSAGLSVVILDAMPRPGGRIHSVYTDQQIDGEFHPRQARADLGPTWVWPEYQPTVRGWIEKLNVETVAQYDDGLAVVERQPGATPEQHQLPGQHGIKRLRGGPQALINALYRRLHPDSVLLGHRVARIADDPDKSQVHVTAESAESIDCQFIAKQVMIATPLRVAHEAISFNPGLPENIVQIMQQTPTWMAPQAKVVVIYATAFWRDQGLSGRVASQAGPLVEIHDHCSADGKTAALFGFVGVPAAVRATHREALEAAIREQLVRCFGSVAADPLAVEMEDWAMNSHICTAVDLSGPAQHPGIAPTAIRQAHFNGRLRFAVAETAVENPGLIDGAFEAGSKAAAEIAATFAE